VPIGRHAGRYCRALVITADEGEITTENLPETLADQSKTEIIYMDLFGLDLDYDGGMGGELEQLINSLLHYNPQYQIVATVAEQPAKRWSGMLSWLIVHAKYNQYLGVPCNELVLEVPGDCFDGPFALPFSTATEKNLLPVNMGMSRERVTNLMNALRSQPSWRLLPRAPGSHTERETTQ
jgi:hypothetical protein